MCHRHQTFSAALHLILFDNHILGAELYAALPSLLRELRHR